MIRCSWSEKWLTQKSRRIYYKKQDFTAAQKIEKATCQRSPLHKRKKVLSGFYQWPDCADDVV